MKNCIFEEWVSFIRYLNLLLKTNKQPMFFFIYMEISAGARILVKVGEKTI